MYNSKAILSARAVALLLILGSVAEASFAQSRRAAPGSPRSQREKYDQQQQQKRASQPKTAIETTQGAKAIENYYTGAGAKFDDWNRAVGGLWSNDQKRALLVKYLQNETKKGASLREALGVGFNKYVEGGVKRYADQGQILNFDPSMTALDKTLAIYSATRGGDVPRLKSLSSVGVQVNLDKTHRDQMLKLLGSDFAEVYSEELKERVPNPREISFDLKTQSDIDAFTSFLAKKYSPEEAYIIVAGLQGSKKTGRTIPITINRSLNQNGLTLNTSQTFVVPELELTSDSRPIIAPVATGKPDSFKHIESDGIGSDPSIKRLLESPDTVVIEFDPNNAQIFNQRSAFIRFNGDRMFQIFNSLESVNDAQLASALAIHVSASNFDNLQSRIAEDPYTRVTDEMVRGLQDLDKDLYQGALGAVGSNRDESSALNGRSSEPNKERVRTKRQR
jgi:hypothetical protein